MLKPFKQSFGFQEKHAVATLQQNQMRLPWKLHDNRLTKKQGVVCCEHNLIIFFNNLTLTLYDTIEIQRK
jgi:hypothetical protein